MKFWPFGRQTATKPIVIKPGQRRLANRQREAIEPLLAADGLAIVTEKQREAAERVPGLETEKRRLEAESKELGKRPTLEEHQTLQKELRIAREQMSHMIPEEEVAERLSGMVSEEEFQKLEARLRASVPAKEHREVLDELEKQKAKNESLQTKLAQAEDKARKRGRMISDLIRSLMNLYSRLNYAKPPEGDVIAFCSRDAEGVIASVQLSRTGAVSVGYPPIGNWNYWLSMIDTHQERVERTPRGMPPKAEIKDREVILVGFYPAEADRQSLQKLHANGIRVTLIVDREADAPDFTTVVRGTSLPRAVEKYLSGRNISGGIYETLAALGDACRNGGSEEAAYLRDSLASPVGQMDERYIRGLVDELFQKGTLVGSDIYPGVIIKAKNYRELREDGFHI